MTADPLQDRLNEHAFIDLNQHLLDDSPTRIGFQQ